MKRLFLLTTAAKNDLKEILLDIAEDSPDTAQRVRSKFYGGLQALGRSPGIGHYDEELLGRASGTFTPMSSLMCGKRDRFK